MFRPKFFYNANGAGSGGGDGQAAGSDAGSGTTTPTGGGDVSGQAPTGDNAQPGSDDQTIKLSDHQKELDRVAGKARKEALRVYAKELGLEDEKALEAIIKAKQDADDQARTDLEKANDEKAAAEKRATETEARAKNALLRAAFDREGVSEIEDLDSAFVVAGSLGLLGDESGLEIDLENARVSGMEKVIKKLIDQKPLFKKGSQAQPAGTGGSERGTTTPTDQPTNEEKAAYRRRFGIRT